MSFPNPDNYGNSCDCGPTNSTPAPSQIQSEIDAIETNLAAHEAAYTNVHGIGDTSVLATINSASNLIPRYAFGWPANRLTSLPADPSFIGAATAYSGTELSGFHVMYVPIFIGNNVSGFPRLFLPKTNTSSLIVKASILGGDPTTGGFLTPVYTWPSGGGTSLAYPEDGFVSWTAGSTASFNRGLYFIAFRFESGAQNGIYVMDTSTTVNQRPTLSEITFRTPAFSYYSFDSAKIIRVGSILRRYLAAPPWPPVDNITNLNPCAEFTGKRIVEVDGPAATPQNANSTSVSFVTQGWSGSITRANDAVYPGPTLVSTSPSPAGGWNYLTSANPGVYNASTSSYFEVLVTPSSGTSGTVTLTGFEFYSRSTGSGPTNVTVAFLDSANNVLTVSAFTVPTTSVWTLLTGTVSVPITVSTSAPSFKVRIYGSGGSAPSASGNWRIDGFKLTGSYASSIAQYSFSEILPLFYFGFSNVVSGGSGP